MNSDRIFFHLVFFAKNTSRMTSSFYSFKCERISERLVALRDELSSRRRFTKAFRDRTYSALDKANEMLGEIDSELEHLDTKALEGYDMSKKRKLSFSDSPSSD